MKAEMAQCDITVDAMLRTAYVCIRHTARLQLVLFVCLKTLSVISGYRTAVNT
jgi:hypothetical protein